jgi:hypothetical protein
VVNEILWPKAGDAVSGDLTILGTALIQAFRRYDVHISTAGNDDWQWLTTKYEVVRDGILFHFDTNDFADGYYDLRVRALNDRGDYSEAFVPNLEIRNANPPTGTPFLDEAGVRRFISYLPTPTPSPSPTPTSESRVLGGRGIYAPVSGAIVRGLAPIIATVNGDRYFPFERYELAISPAGADNWTWLYAGEQQFWQDEIFQLDTRLFDDGYYDIRLRNVFTDGNYGEYFVRNIQFVNDFFIEASPGPGITFPHDGSVVSDIVDFRGTATDPNFLRWELYWSPASADTWSFLVSSDRQVENSLLARLDLNQLPYGAYDFRLRIVRQDTNYDDYEVRNVWLTSPTPTPLPTSTPTMTSTPAG